ncbi:tail fiber domain-containing protein [Ruegeria sp. HKCCA4812]|uniref:tail fiber domain-containing protein n=1 Tax=Ruegeria sp. HKCCA4812 TaxID=2682993 RepID=UPI0014883610|nr:tail fiber domain-containing protein [Ruegeria sp. HKCCA4812]
MVAGFDPLRTQAIQTAQESVGKNLESADVARGSLTAMLGQGALESAKQNVIEGLMPSINATFAHSGMTGSDLHQQNLTKGLSTGLAQLEDNALNRRLSAANALQGLGQFTNNQSGFLDQLGTGRQQHAQDEINADMLRDQQTKSADLDALRNYLSLTSGVGSAFGVQTATQSGGNSGLLGILGLGLQAAPLLSDRRVKEDIKRVGAMDDGTPVYTYRYKGGNTYHMGVMADEVEDKHPDAVVTLPSGIQAVHYGSL